MAINTIFSERLNLLMKERGVTQTTLSDAVGITKQSISMYANAHRVPDIDVFKKICEFFEVSADYLLGLSDVKSFDIEEKAISEKLGLSSEAIDAINSINYGDDVITKWRIGGTKLLNAIIEDEHFRLTLFQIAQYLINVVYTAELEKYILNFAGGEDKYELVDKIKDTPLTIVNGVSISGKKVPNVCSMDTILKQALEERNVIYDKNYWFYTLTRNIETLLNSVLEKNYKEILFDCEAGIPDLDKMKIECIKNLSEIEEYLLEINTK